MTNKYRKLQALPASIGLQKLFDEAYRIIGLPALMHDMEYNIICYAQEVVSDDPIWNTYVRVKAATPKTLELLKTESFIETAANAKDIVILKSSKLRHDRIFGKLYNAEHIQIGCVCMLAQETFLDGEPELFALFCEKLNGVLAGMESLTVYGQHYRNHLLAALIESEIADKEMYSAHIESIYSGLHAYLFLAVVQGTTDDLPSPAAAMKLLKCVYGQFCYAEYRDKLLVLVSGQSETDTAMLQELCDFAASKGLRVLASPAFCNLFDLHHVYRELVKEPSN